MIFLINIFLRLFGYELLFRRYKGPSASVGEKRETIRSYAKKYHLRTLIETGTYLGDTVEDLKGDFERIVSIELGKDLYERAVFRFRNDRNVKLIHGDSGIELVKLMKSISQPALFWLDSHYSGDITAQGKMNTPIKQELAAIFAHPNKNHVVLIDDIRDFSGRNGYPTVPELKRIVTESEYYCIEIENGIARIEPR